MNLTILENEISDRLIPLRTTLEQFSIPVSMLPKNPMGLSEDEENGIVNIWISSLNGNPITNQNQQLRLTVSCRISVVNMFSDTDLEKNSIQDIFSILYDLLVGFRLTGAIQNLYLNSYNIGVDQGRWEANCDFFCNLDLFIQQTPDPSIVPTIQEIRERLQGLEIVTTNI